MQIFSLEVPFTSRPKGMWLLIGIGAILAANIATGLSLAFLSLTGLHIIYEVADFLSASLAGLLTGCLFWGAFILRPKHATVGRGVILGAVSGLCAHPLWLVFFNLMDILSALKHFEMAQVVLWLVLGFDYTLISWVYVGWITAIVGGVAGGLLVFFQYLLTQRLSQRHSP